MHKLSLVNTLNRDMQCLKNSEGIFVAYRIFTNESKLLNGIYKTQVSLQFHSFG